MSRSLPRTALVAVLAALLVGLLAPASQAAAVPRVKGVGKAGQDGSALVVRWRPVAGATYQLRWAGSAKALRRGPVVSTGATQAATGPLSRGGRWFAQVRAVRGAKAGAWSRPKAMKLSGGAAAASGPLTGQGLPGQVRFSWPGWKGAHRYRVEWNAAWAGLWPGTTYVDGGPGGWVGAGARSSTLTVPAAPGPGDRLLAVDYGNPVFAKLQAGNKKGRVTRSTRWIPVFSAPPAPPAGNTLRMATYNVSWNPQDATRVNAIAANINSHQADVVALQEANKLSVPAILRALGPGWASSPENDGSQSILFRTGRFEQQAAGVFTIRNRAEPNRPLPTPWVQLRDKAPGGRSFLVTSVHVFSANTGSMAEDNRWEGYAAQDVDDNMNAVNASRGLPIILAGDLQYGREPFDEVADRLPAQPTLVRRGWYDAIAAPVQVGMQFSTYNVVNGVNQAHQAAHSTGIAPRGDHVMIKGVRGSLRYENVANWSWNGVVPSDHNLVMADLRLPY